MRIATGMRFVVRAEETPTAFLESERAIHQFAVSLCRKTFTTLVLVEP